MFDAFKLPPASQLTAGPRPRLRLHGGGGGGGGERLGCRRLLSPICLPHCTVCAPLSTRNLAVEVVFMFCLEQGPDGQGPACPWSAEKGAGARVLRSGHKQRLDGRAVRCPRGQVVVGEAVPLVPNS